jgi:hypothetical protein
MTAPQPTLSDFLAFISTTMQVPTAALPPTSPWPGVALGISLAIVNPALQNMPIPQFDAANVQLNTGGFSIYSQCVYYLAADTLLNITPDVPGFTYFARQRRKFNLNGFTSGVVQSSGNEASNVSMVVQDAAKAFTLANVQQLKTPYGRQYLQLAQGFGPSTWGIT